MLGSCHYVWSSLILVVLHPALTEELPVQNKMFTQNEQTHHGKNISTFHVCPSLYPPPLTSTIFICLPLFVFLYTHLSV